MYLPFKFAAPKLLLYAKLEHLNVYIVMPYGSIIARIELLDLSNVV